MTKRFAFSIIAVTLFISSCNNEDKKTLPPVDSTATTYSGKGQIDSLKKSADTIAVIPPKKTEATKNGLSKPSVNVPPSTEKTNGNANTDVISDHAKKTAHKADSTVKTKNAEPVVTQKQNATAPDEKLVPASVADNSKAFAPKYGLIPRDATENNITSFKNAFPDKQTLVKINYDADPDAEMQVVRTKIIAALKKCGYTNVSEKSITFHPSRMPKDIHYELQRDGSVIIWLQPADIGQ